MAQLTHYRKRRAVAWRRLVAAFPFLVARWVKKWYTSVEKYIDDEIYYCSRHNVPTPRTAWRSLVFSGLVVFNRPASMELGTFEPVGGGRISSWLAPALKKYFPTDVWGSNPERPDYIVFHAVSSDRGERVCPGCLGDSCYGRMVTVDYRAAGYPRVVIPSIDSYDMTPAIQSCPTCRGDGTITQQHGASLPCPTCRQLGAAVAWAGAFWAWRHPFNDYSVYERRFEKTVQLLVNVFLGLLAIGGILVGGRELLSAIDRSEVALTLVSRSWSMTAWWVGWLAVEFLVFRVIRAKTNYKTIPPATTQPDTSVDWETMTVPEDVSAYCTEESMTILERAWGLAKFAGAAMVMPAHVLAAASERPSIGSMFVRLAIPPSTLRDRALQLPSPASTGGIIGLSSGTRELLLSGFLQAAKDGRARITPPYLLAGIATLEDPARELLFDLNVDEQKLAHVIEWMKIQEDLKFNLRRYASRAAAKPKGAIDRAYTASATPTLNRFSTDLTRLARDGRLPYVIGRDDQLAHAFRIVASGRRSVLFVGDAGVGLTTILHALAERMVSEDVPEILQDKRLVMLSATALVAGAGAVGQVEERVETILAESINAGNIILAIEDVDQLVGVASTGGRGLDVATIIGQQLSQHSLIAFATVKTAAFRQVIEQTGIINAFEKVDVPEMTADEAIVAIESRIGNLEFKHKVIFSYEAIAQSVGLSNRYLHEKTLPGKAIELMEEAAVAVKRDRGANALVTGEDIAKIVTEQTKITVTAMTGDEQQKLLHLEDELHRRVIGQDEAVKAVANALRRARAELRDGKRPIANLLFLGPTGVGKTELAKTVAASYFGSEEAMIRLDMSEYQDVSSINRLIGAPPGYAGAQVGGYLTDAVRHNPFALVLLDELEKAHPDILNLFLQVMDDGRLTDSLGRTVDFTNVILIATSNAGTQHIQQRLQEKVQLATIKQELLSDVLLQWYRPEFLNRFDAIVLFTPLNLEEVRLIVELMVANIAKQLATKGITLQASPEAIAELAQTGFDPLFGARPLRRAVQEHVDNALAQFLLQGKLNRRDVAILEPGGTIRVETAMKV